MNCRQRLFSLLLIFTALALLAGCGVKGPVTRLPQPRPSAPADMTLHQSGDDLLLSWELPRTNQDGSELTDLAAFRVYRQQFEPDEDCPDCRNDLTLWRLVELDYLRHAQLRGRRLYLTDRGLQAGQGYRYKVVPYNRWGASGAYVEQRQVLATPPPAPRALQARPSADGLQLSWQAPAELPEGMELLGYQLYRRRPGQTFGPAPRNRELLNQPRFEDSNFEAGRSYVYAVRTIVMQNGRVLESALSNTLVVTPRRGF